MTTKVQNPTIVSVSYDELVNVLKSVVHHTFFHINQTTKVRMNKGGRQGLNEYFEKVFKTSDFEGLTVTNYEGRVNNNREKEGLDRDFVVSENKVGHHVSPCVTFNEKLGRSYLMYEYFLENRQPEVVHRFEGNEIDKMVFDQWVIKSNDYQNQGEQKKVFVLQVDIKNINFITLNHVTYVQQR